MKIGIFDSGLGGFHRQSETKPPAGWRPPPALPFPALPQPVPLPLFAPEDYHGNSRLPEWCPGQWSEMCIRDR